MSLNFRFKKESLQEGFIVLLMVLTPLTVLKAYNDQAQVFKGEPIHQKTPYGINERYQISLETIDTGFCEPIDLTIMPIDYPSITSDTLMACVYEDVTITARYTGTLELQYLWSNGSSSPNLILSATGVGIEIRKIWLEVTDAQTGCIYSDTLIVFYDFKSCVGVNEMDGDWPVRVFPNPAKDVLSVEYSDIRGPIQLIISSIAGQVVFQESYGNSPSGINQIQLNLQFLPRGLYLLKLISGDKVQTEKILLD